MGKSEAGQKTTSLEKKITSLEKRTATIHSPREFASPSEFAGGTTFPCEMRTRRLAAKDLPPI